MPYSSAYARVAPSNGGCRAATSRAASPCGAEQRRARGKGACFSALCCVLAVSFAGCDGSSTVHYGLGSQETPGEADGSEPASAATPGSSAARPSEPDGGARPVLASEAPAMTSTAPTPATMQNATPAGADPSPPQSPGAGGSAGAGASAPDSGAGGGEAETAGGSHPAPPASPGGSEPEPPAAGDTGVEPAAEPTGEEGSNPQVDGPLPDPGSETPSNQTPSNQTPSGQTPEGAPLGGEPPQDETSTDSPAGDELPAGEGPGDEPPADEGPGDEPPADEGAPPGSDSGATSVGPGSPEIPSGLASFHLTIIGSSTAAGIGASRGDLGWVSLLDAALTARVTSAFSSSNLAQGGYTARDLLPGSSSPGSIDDAIAERPDLIVVALAGSNDLAPDFTTEMFIANLITLRETARAAGIPAFFMGTLPKNFSPIDRETLAAWDRAMAQEFSACWVPGPTLPYAPCYMDVFASLADASLGLAPSLDSGDGQHPNDAGHALLFNRVAPIVAPYVCSKTSCR